MNRNYQFNVSNSRFAYLTGRSLSAFKMDFKAIFHSTPALWLCKNAYRKLISTRPSNCLLIIFVNGRGTEPLND